MKTVKTQIGGIKIVSIEELEILVPEKINAKKKFLPEPMINIVEKEIKQKKDKKTKKEKTYTINVIAYIPNEKHLKTVKDKDSSVKISEYVYLRYNGLIQIETWIKSDNENGMVYSRDFEVVFDAHEKVEAYDLSKISFTYELVNPKLNAQAEAVLVRLFNEDPETSRGTLTTIKKKK